MADEAQAIVIDNGSSTCKAGFAGNEAPSDVFPSVVGYPKDPNLARKGQGKGIFIGDETFRKSCILNLHYPIENGIVVDWDNMEKLIHHTIKEELRVDPSEHAVLLTESPTTPKGERERMIQLMFETFNVPAYYSASPAVLDLFSTGRIDGISLGAGYGASHIVPISEGISIPYAIMKFNISGRDLTDWLQKILNKGEYKHGYVFKTSAEKEAVRDIKENCAYVALDYDAELQKAKNSSECDVSYTLPDGEVITISDERFRCPELLFNPRMNDFDFDGIHKAIVDSIMKCDIDFREDLFANIVLSGGTTMFEGLQERLEKEITKLAPPKMNVNIAAQPKRKYATWIGGSVFACIHTFQGMAITRDEYKDAGPGIVHRKCRF